MILFPKQIGLHIGIGVGTHMANREKSKSKIQNFFHQKFVNNIQENTSVKLEKSIH